MSKQNNRQEMMRYGNFIADRIFNKDGHTTFIEIRTSSGNWKMRFDESTWLFGLMKEIVGMNPNKEETPRYKNYIHSVTNILYQFGTCGIPVEMLTNLDKMLNEYIEQTAKNTPSPTEEEEKETLDEMKREYEMRDEIKNIEKNEKK